MWNRRCVRFECRLYDTKWKLQLSKRNYCVRLSLLQYTIDILIKCWPYYRWNIIDSHRNRSETILVITTQYLDIFRIGPNIESVCTSYETVMTWQSVKQRCHNLLVSSQFISLSFDLFFEFFFSTSFLIPAELNREFWAALISDSDYRQKNKIPIVSVVRAHSWQLFYFFSFY